MTIRDLRITLGVTNRLFGVRTPRQRTAVVERPIDVAYRFGRAFEIEIEIENDVSCQTDKFETE